ncbi:hypothetical protein BIW11_10570 [Tropilaelaps mercedesae]|uniref:Uncharacterized protein n=1 Tax=Tropilaelaps mercedesae TaxID=418985 RepID=A0A1V9XF08_9ACAR|nr:hypothetical protein BIW11_10570 [Tropilaelaps mercedesae]
MVLTNDRPSCCRCLFTMHALWQRIARRLTDPPCPPVSNEPPSESPLALATASGSGAPTSSASGVSDDASALDSIESSETRLKHPTAGRARPPARRPPSHIGSPPGQKEGTSILEVNGDPSGRTDGAVVHLGLNGVNGHTGISGQNGHESDVGKRTSIKDLTSKFVDTNGGPVPQVINLAGRPLPNGLTTRGCNASSSNPSANISSNRLTNLSRDDVDAKTDEDPTVPNCSNETAQKLEAEVLELRVEVKKLRESSVSREEYSNLLAQMKQLQETMEANRAHYSKMVRELMTEVDEEKKQRMNLQVEIDRLKKITVTV